MIIAVNHVDRPDRLERLPAEWDVWKTDVRIQETYRRIAIAAKVEGWGADVIVVQDDIRFTVDPLPIPATHLTIYGQTSTTTPGHVCPRAFSADQHAWNGLHRLWDGSNTQICLAWAELHPKAIIHDVTAHLEPVS